MRVPREIRNSSSAPVAPHRAFVRVSREAWAEFHERWAEIDRLWVPCGDPEHIDAVASLRMSARDDLRADIRAKALLQQHQGNYLVPV